MVDAAHPASRISSSDVLAFLVNELDRPAIDVAYVGAGAHSACFGFMSDGRELVIRFSALSEDFERDRRAYGFDGPDLPIPRVIHIGEGLDGYYAISERVRGSALERCDWTGLVDPVARVLEALRTTDLSSTSGWGAFDEDGAGSFDTHREFMLSVGVDPPGTRVHGWLDNLETSPNGSAAFRRWFRVLDEMAMEDVPRSLVHRDLLHENVLVRDGAITGVLDWGAAFYGDHLYDLAVLEFWAPWLWDIQPAAVRARLEEMWGPDESGTRAQRLTACLLRVGLDTLRGMANNTAWHWQADVEKRLDDLVLPRL